MLLLVALPLAHAFDSQPQPVLFQTNVELFNNLEVSSGPIPSGSPLAVDVGLNVNGGGSVRMEGQGTLSWPEGMTFGLVPTRDRGTFNVDVDVAAIVNLNYDVFGISGAYPFQVVNFPVAATTTFNPWALNQRVQANQTLDPYEVFSFPLDITIADVTLTGTVTPQVTTGYVTTRWSADGNNVTQANRTVTLAPDRVAQYPVNVSVAGQFDSTATLNLTGSISACNSWLGCVGPYSYTYPFELSSETVDAEFPVRRLVFPLPMLDADLDLVEFGDVEIGRVDSVEVNLDNDGALPASGTIALEGGDGAFAVTPSTFEAPAGGSDVLVVTFAPTDDVASDARLVITSNDPTAPTITIPLTGNGGAPDDVDGAIDGKVTSSDGCGCATGGRDQAAIGVLAMGAALVTRRRSRRA
jgi:MYXO-CTERM domain-containing protein